MDNLPSDIQYHIMTKWLEEEDMYNLMKVSKKFSVVSKRGYVRQISYNQSEDLGVFLKRYLAHINTIEKVTMHLHDSEIFKWFPRFPREVEIFGYDVTPDAIDTKTRQWEKVERVKWEDRCCGRGAISL